MAQAQSNGGQFPISSPKWAFVPLTLVEQPGALGATAKWGAS
jgi:hypothetical protein